MWLSAREMVNQTNKQNRTFSRSCSFCSSSTPHRIEPNSTLVRSCSASSDCSKQSRGLCIPQCRTNSWIGLGSHNINKSRKNNGWRNSTNTATSSQVRLARIPWFLLENEKPNTFLFLVILSSHDIYNVLSSGLQTNQENRAEGLLEM